MLRGLGAIQPGVNRCKLIADSDFDLLYKDCTTSRYNYLFVPVDDDDNVVGIGVDDLFVVGIR